jgi:hypothetical protein
MEIEGWRTSECPSLQEPQSRFEVAVTRFLAQQLSTACETVQTIASGPNATMENEEETAWTHQAGLVLVGELCQLGGHVAARQTVLAVA